MSITLQNRVTGERFVIRQSGATYSVARFSECEAAREYTWALETAAKAVATAESSPLFWLVVR